MLDHIAKGGEQVQLNPSFFTTYSALIHYPDDGWLLTGELSYQERTVDLVANDDNGEASTVPAYVKQVTVSSVTNDANDWVRFPAIDDLPAGTTIEVICNAGSNFNIRTPVDSDETINGVNADGTNEYLATDGDIVRLTSNGTGWVGVSIQSTGAIRSAVTPA